MSRVATTSLAPFASPPLLVLLLVLLGTSLVLAEGAAEVAPSASKLEDITSTSQVLSEIQLSSKQAQEPKHQAKSKHQSQQYPAINLVKLSNTSGGAPNLKALASSYLVSGGQQSPASTTLALGPSRPNRPPHPRPNLPALELRQSQHQHQHQRAQAPAGPRASNNKSLLDKICIGTSHRLAEQHNRTEHYLNLVERYRDCTYVIGNLELTWLDNGLATGGGGSANGIGGESGAQLDLSFLESIKEITGYLLIAHVNLDRIRIPNLQIIRGRDLFKLNDNLNGNHQPEKSEDFGLILIENQLNALELPNLREILAGSFGSYYNTNLCHLLTIHSDKILNSPYKKLFVFNGTQPECPSPCDDSCQVGCWSEGPDMCQKSSKQNCATSCSSGRCFGPLASECCHPFCAGGCTGPKQTDCLACKNFYDDGECIQECPSMQRYNPSKFLWELNPNGKYAFGATCVKDCPEHLLRDNGACVRTCPPNKRSVNGECVPCGGPCPKNCQGVEVVHSGNIDQLINCTVIEGSITILDSSFSGRVGDTSSSGNLIGLAGANSSSANKHKPMHPNRLEVFKTLREITGYLNIQAEHPDFKNLSYFRNLKVIGGRQTTDMFHALSITRSSLVSLNLRSLRKVRSGRITIEDNRELCFADTIDWMQINITRREDITTRNNGELAKCRQLGLVCHEQCAQDGCWGPGPDECLSCNNYKLDDYCVDNCNNSLQSVGFLSYDSGQRTCKKCHQECRSGCDGTEAVHCKQCKSVKDGPYCVGECPNHKYNNNGTCEECDKSCADGCTGPSSKLGDGGCNSCHKAVINSTDPHFAAYCIRPDDPCPDAHYQEYVGPQAEGPLKWAAAGKPVCRKCHHRCKSCTGMGTHTSVCECAKYVAGEQCEDYCPRDYFADDHFRRCVKCSPECNGCFGPTEADCFSCRVYRIYYQHQDSQGQAPAQDAGGELLAPQGGGGASGSGNNQQQTRQQRFNCTAQCPAEKPHRISESNMLDPFCSDIADVDVEKPRLVPMGPAAICLILLVASASFMVCFSVHRCQIEKHEKVKLSMHLSGLDDVEPLNPSNMKPNLASLKSIKENELRRGRVLGKGVGGVVYQGFWFPESAEKAKRRRRVAVAIKVLKDNGQANLNKEFLDEAYIMASVDHPNLVKLLAVCVIPKSLMLITQLMPHGCLLDYVRNNRSCVSSKRALEWSKQIARGMKYLEERRMVHRDLALRNVLLQTPRKALISDFGLAKFLENDQNEYQSGLGCVLPIRWLAPECITKRKFTHKSDVWAFGVTVWELLTFGEIPFKEYETIQVPKAIAKGARLPQTHAMSLPFYMVIFSCWFYEPDDRPKFAELDEAFTFFAKDPERFLPCFGGAHKLGCEFSASKQTAPQACQGQRSGGQLVSEEEANFTDEAEMEDDEMEEDEVDGDEEHGDDEDDDDERDDDDDDDDEATTARNIAAIPDLTPSTHNRLNEQMFGFELARAEPTNSAAANRSHSLLSDTDSPTTDSRSTQQLLKGRQHHSHAHQHNIKSIVDNDEVFAASVQLGSLSRRRRQQQHERFAVKSSSEFASDFNNNEPASASLMDSNNNNSNGHRFNCWQMHHTISSGNMTAHKSEQPTDIYDYLLPSSFTLDYENFQQTRHLLSSTNSSGCGSSSGANRNPPHSAGLVTNEEYFMSLEAVAKARSSSSTSSSINSTSSSTNAGPTRAKRLERLSQSRLPTKTSGAVDGSADSYGQHHERLQSALDCSINLGRQLSTSTGNIPHSLV